MKEQILKHILSAKVVETIVYKPHGKSTAPQSIVITGKDGTEYKYESVNAALKALKV